MEIVVCVKQTFDTEAVISLDEQGEIDERSVKFILNPFDEYAVEEAIRICGREGGTVTAVSVDGRDPSQALRHCLAMGVDRAVWLDLGDARNDGTHCVAGALSAWLREAPFDLVLLGKGAVDNAESQVPARVAEMLDLPQITCVSKLEIKEKKALARREVDNGHEILEAELPCVVSARKGLNEPRYPSMRRILQAGKATIQRVTLDELFSGPHPAVTPLTQVEEYIIPAGRKPGRILDGSPEEAVNELLSILTRERKIS